MVHFRHLVLTAFVGTLVVWLTNGVDAPEDATAGLLGFLIGIFALNVGRHISNLLIFGYVSQHPHAISGQLLFSKLTSQGIFTVTS